MKQKTTKQRAATVGRILLGSVLMPLLAALFIADRVILVFLPHIQGETIQESFKTPHKFVAVFYRVGFISFVYLLKLLFEYLF